MDLKKEQQYIEKIQKCQRNWDHSRTIPQEHIDHWLWIAQNSPSKQYEGYYDVYYAKKPEVIEDLLDHTWGFTWSTNPPSCVRNPQMGANFYMCFVSKTPNTQRNFNNDGTAREQGYAGRNDNAIVSIGIALGLIARSAAELGYSTGYNKNMSSGPDSNRYWERKMGIYDEAVEGSMRIEYGIGIGYAQSNRSWTESDQTEVLVGSANGEKTTLEPHVIKGYRQCAIVDSNYKTAEFNGIEYALPNTDTITYPSFSTDPDRIINCREIL